MRLAAMALILSVPCFSQSTRSDSDVYFAFFARVAAMRSMTGGIVILNGERVPGNVVASKVQENFGLTDDQMKALTTIADDFWSENRAIDGDVRRAEFEARMRRIADQEVPTEGTQLKADAETRRSAMVLDHVKQLKAALGVETFRALDARARSMGTDSSVLPVKPKF
jgi:hypothetical protein